MGLDQKKPNQRTLQRFGELGPIYRRTILGHDLTFVGSAELAKGFLDEERWEKYVGGPIEGLRSIVGDGLFTAYNWESNWSVAHEVLMPAFSREAMVTYHDAMLEVVDELTGYLRNHDGTYVPAWETLGKLTVEIIGRCGFSTSFDSFTSDRDDEFVAAMTRVLHFAQTAGIPIPFIGPLLRRNQEREFIADRQLLYDRVEGVIAERKATGERRPDLLDRMLHPDDGAQELDLENIRNQVLTFLVAGHETTLNTMSFAFHFLAQHRDIADRVRAEATEVVGEDGVLRYDEVGKLKYTRQVIHETLRLWPTAPGFFRSARADTTVGGYEFSSGEWVFILLLSTQRDPAWGADADEFNPDRFAGDANKGRPPELFKPFGTGIRSCIGRQFALHELALVLASVVLRFDITPEPGYDLDVAEKLTLRPDGLALRFAERPSTA